MRLGPSDAPYGPSPAPGPFVQLAIAKNAKIDFSNHSTGHHGFDLLDDNSRSREIIQRTLDFIRAYNSP